MTSTWMTLQLVSAHQITEALAPPTWVVCYGPVVRLSAIISVSCLVLAVSGVVIGACGSGDSGDGTVVDLCTPGPSKCSADPMPSSADQAKFTQGCKDSLAGACAAQAKAALACIAEKQKCGSDNKTDTAALLVGCMAESTALSACHTPNVDSGVGTGVDSGTDSNSGANEPDVVVTPNVDSGAE